ncbi:MAG TPA: helix-turn-helix domain-containing protein, partial [Streptosporangiaceae bacterium]|nr:helix-turn-helix domain-containing protein [Streptosporangiaceae bacterium]
ARTGKPATRQVAAVQRAIAIMDELAAARTELGTNEIARRTGINVSTVSRILATLADGGLVGHVPSTGRYRIGTGIVRLAGAVELDIRSLARPHRGTGQAPRGDRHAVGARRARGVHARLRAEPAERPQCG